MAQPANDTNDEPSIGYDHPTVVPSNHEPEVVEQELTYGVDHNDFHTAIAKVAVHVVGHLGDEVHIYSVSGMDRGNHSIVNLFVEYPGEIDFQDCPDGDGITMLEHEVFG